MNAPVPLQTPKKTKKTKKKMNSYEYFAMSKTLTDQAEKLLSMAKHLQAMGEKMLYKEIPRANHEDWDAEIRREEDWNYSLLLLSGSSFRGLL